MFSKSKFITSVPGYDQFQYKFVIVPTIDKYQILNNNNEVVGEVKLNKTKPDSFSYTSHNVDPEQVEKDWSNYKQRPEFLVGHPVIFDKPVTEFNQTQLIDMYENLLVGCTLMRYKDRDSKIDSIESMLNWLRQTDFYNAPASTVYHDAYPFGLLYHSLKVYDNIVELKKLSKFNSVNIASAALVALTHDWCKIGLYKSFKKNVKNEETNKWEQVTAYTREQTGVPLGHGTSSMYLINKCINLTVEEALAIRWHMGMYNVSNPESFELENANESFPLVRMLQFADQLACVKY